jgi:hypothetical protein
MINQQQERTLQERTAELLAWHGILLTAQERAEIEIADDEGAIVSEFSSTSRDGFDLFTDARIRRVPERVEE